MNEFDHSAGRAVRRRRDTPIGVVTEVEGPVDVSLVGARFPRHRQTFAALRQRGWHVEVVDDRPPRARVVVHFDRPPARSDDRVHVELAFDCAGGDWSVVAGDQRDVFVMCSSAIEAAAAIERATLTR
jgi:hypothetical protein